MRPQLVAVVFLSIPFDTARATPIEDARKIAELQAQIAALKASAHTTDSTAADIKYTQDVNDEAARMRAADAKHAIEEKAVADAKAEAAAKRERDALASSASKAVIGSWAGAITSFLVLAGLIVTNVFPPLWKDHIDERNRKRLEAATAASEARLLAAVHAQGEKIAQAIEKPKAQWGSPG